MRHKPVTNFTLNAKDPIPPPPGCDPVNDQRPPPKIINYYKATNGYSPNKVRKMIAEQKAYLRECELVDAQRDLAKFEEKHHLTKKEQIQIPNYPEPPKVDMSVIQAFEPPEETKFYEYQIPRNPLKPKHEHHHDEMYMARGCPCCNPSKYSTIRPRTACSTMGTTRTLEAVDEVIGEKKRRDLPYQIGQSYWNVLDETTMPERPKPDKFEPPKNRPVFSTMRTGPRPAGIPICVEDLITSRAKGEAKFQQEMARKDDIALQKREALLRTRAETSRTAYDFKRSHTRAISTMSGQTWMSDYAMRTARRAKTRAMQRELERKSRLTKDEQDEVKRLNDYDDKLYKEYKSSRQPEDELQRLIYQTGFKMQ